MDLPARRAGRYGTSAVVEQAGGIMGRCIHVAAVAPSLHALVAGVFPSEMRWGDCNAAAPAQAR